MNRKKNVREQTYVEYIYVEDKKCKRKESLIVKLLEKVKEFLLQKHLSEVFRTEGVHRALCLGLWKFLAS